MEKTEVWPAVHRERRALADDLESIQDDGWTSPSLCDHWTVRDVLAHMTASAKITPASFFPMLASSGFRLSRMQAKGIAAERGASAAQTLERFKEIENSVRHPPGPIDAMLGETIIHGEDIRRAIGISYEYPIGEVARVADFYKGSNLIIGAKQRIAGLTLRADDTNWTHGSGPEVAGPIISIVMAMTGRKAALDDLSGDGVQTLRTRR